MLTVIFDAGPLITACKFDSQGKLIEVAEAILKVIRPRYRVRVIEYSPVRLQEVKQDAESRGAG